MGNPQKNSVHSLGLEDVQGVSPDINDGPQKLFLQTLVYDNNDQCHTIYTLPDGGNRAQCIIRDDVFEGLFGAPANKSNVVPAKEQVYTAARGGRVQVLGKTREPIEFFFADGRFAYKVRPLVVKNFILPCLLGASDLKNMRMKINYEHDFVEMGRKRIRQKLVTRPGNESTGIHTVQNTTVYPGRMQIIPVRAQDALGGGDLLILPEGEFEEIAVASVNPVRNSGLAYTQIVNWTDHPITIKAGQRFGTGFIAAVQKKKEETGQGYPEQMTKAHFLKKLTKDFKVEDNTYLYEVEKRELLELL